MNTKDYTLIRLFDDATGNITHHLTSLSDADKYLRFGYMPQNEAIEEYVATTIVSANNNRHDSHFWFGIMLDQSIVATLHVAIFKNAAEFAFSTAEEHRGKKLGQLLFARGYQLVTEYGISRICICFLNENAAMKRIVSKFGFSAVSTGSTRELESELLVRPPSLGDPHKMFVDLLHSNQ